MLLEVRQHVLGPALALVLLVLVACSGLRLVVVVAFLERVID